MDNPAFIYAEKVKSASNRLYSRLKINAFSYSKIYKDGSRSELWSDSEALAHSFLGKKHIEKVYTPPLFGKQECVIYELVIENFPPDLRKRISRQLSDQKDLFNYCSCLVLIDYQEDYTEYCTFYSPASEVQAINNYMNDLDYLKKFRRFFRHHAKEFIREADEHKLILPWITTERHSNSPAPRIITSPFSDSNSIILTPREEEISELLLDGLTAKESSEVLCVSSRTVEQHIYNIKRKFGVNRRSKLITELNRYHHQ
ncbi:LuxR C-terminal-related transcriptional regulator [Vibrio marisflavi]|uniref:HTH luxR-type domain-containing protein n=1 Tax=Vibrio marisflavi CECT 7928 TaxID=634439 RepID=A0ABN8E521_9VIBR|nr:LuxR C-terminal-related transcriptional regulator [Vibrio marisflavi]CAH0539220.1 hypothetical protein VMF7928_01988 [Vibrio marisflavi CECT 7928]